MAFDLNKNDESSNADSKSKFDLSKNDISSGANNGKSGNSKSWLLALLGLLVVGGAAWYFLSKSNSSNTASNASNDSTSNSLASSLSDSTKMNDQNKAALASADSIKSVNSSDTTASGVATSTGDKTKTADISNNASSANNVVNSSNNSTATKTSADINLNNKVPASFAKASASFSNLDKSLVKDILSYLEKNPNASITINGFASSEGEISVNQKISQSRAEAFKKYLISKGALGNRINATGKGIDNPIASNDNEEGRQKNRRVEIVL